ncbi:MAG: hypothetical protein QOE33_3529 [Acidobacteriota bacterium]|nr:hypothetical protein [Acidobacteriota bacterium]
MQEGAFALIDCLGFKGIWKRTDPTLLLKKLSNIDKIINERVTSDAFAFKYLSFGPIRVHVRLLSDTVAISLQYETLEGKESINRQKNILVALMCDSIVKVLNLFLDGEPPLVLRGCVTYGEHLSEGNFIVGPAVDDAAEHMNLAEGAFVWLHPNAALRFRKFQASMIAYIIAAPPELLASALKVMKDPEGRFDHLRTAIEEHGAESVGKAMAEVMKPLVITPVVVDPYPMPLKGGGQLQCPIINPLAFQQTEGDRKSVIDMYSKIITGDRLDIWLKRQHTMDFLEVAERFTAQFESNIAPLREISSRKEDEKMNDTSTEENPLTE